MLRIRILFELLLPLYLGGLKGAPQLNHPLLHLIPVQGQGTAWGVRETQTDSRTRVMTRICILFELHLPLCLGGLKGAPQL